MEAILVSVITSLIASLIFWCFFDYIPHKIRYNKIRPKVEFDIYEICFKLLFYIQAPLQVNIYGSFYPQARLRAGLVSRDEYRLWLQNKCLNDSYKFDEMREKLIPIGSELESISEDICTKIEKCSTYYSFMTAEEILLLRKISAKLTVYSYTENATQTVGQSTLRPLIPNLSYMADNFYEVNQLFCELQEIVWKYKKIDKSINKYLVGDFNHNKAHIAYLNGQYRKCISLLRYRITSHSTTAYSLLFQSYYNIGKQRKALLYLKKYLENTTLKPIYFRNLFEDIYKREEKLGVDILEVLLQHYSDVEVAEMINEIMREQRILDTAIRINKEISEFYASKKERNRMNAKERMSKRQELVKNQIAELQSKKTGH